MAIKLRKSQGSGPNSLPTTSASSCFNKNGKTRSLWLWLKTSQQKMSKLTITITLLTTFVVLLLTCTTTSVVLHREASFIVQVENDKDVLNQVAPQDEVSNNEKPEVNEQPIEAQQNAVEVSPTVEAVVETKTLGTKPPRSFLEDPKEEVDDPFVVDWDKYHLVKLSDEDFAAVKKAEDIVWRWHMGDKIRKQFFGPPSIQQCHGYHEECKELAKIFAPAIRPYLGPNVALNSVNALKREGPNWHAAHSDFGAFQCHRSVQIWIGTDGVSANSTVMGLTHTERAMPGDELMNSRGCCSSECSNYSAPRAPFCTDTDFFHEMQRLDPRMRIIKGPSEAGVAFLIPGRMYHAGFNNVPGLMRSGMIVQFSVLDRSDCIVREQRSFREHLLRRSLPVLLPIPGAKIPETLDGILPNHVWTPSNKLPPFQFDQAMRNPEVKVNAEQHKIAYVPYDLASSMSSWSSTYSSEDGSTCHKRLMNTETTTPSLRFAQLGGIRGPTIPRLSERSFIDKSFQDKNHHTWANGGVFYHEVPKFVYIREGTAFLDMHMRGENEPPYRLDLRQGDLWFIPAGVPHSIVSTTTAFSTAELRFLGRYDQPLVGAKNAAPPARFHAVQEFSEIETNMVQASLTNLGHSDFGFDRHNPQAYGSPCRKNRGGTSADTNQVFLYKDQPITENLNTHNVFVECNLRHAAPHTSKYDVWLIVLEGELTLKVPKHALVEKEGFPVDRTNATETIVVEQGRQFLIPGGVNKEMYSSSAVQDTVDVLVVQLMSFEPKKTGWISTK